MRIWTVVVGHQKSGARERDLAIALLAASLLLVAACAPAATATPSPNVATFAPTGAPTTAPTAVLATSTPVPASTARPTPTTAAATGPKYGGTLKMARPGEDLAWDFMKYSAGGGNLRPIAHMVFSMLASRASAQPKPCETVQAPELAESWKWLDSSTFEVKIRQGAKFHNKPPVNGREVTAEDVAYSYKRGFVTYPVQAIQVYADNTKDIVAKDRYTVQFQTKGPLGILPETLSWSWSLLTLAKESGGPKELWDDPATSWIGSGPFMFQRHMPGYKTILARNPDYFEKGFPYVDTVEQLIMPDRSTREAVMRAGKLDLWDYDVSQLSTEAIRKTSPQIQVQECPQSVSSAPGWLWLNWKDPVWQDVRVRRAALMAIDYKALADVALMGRGTGMYPYPPVLPITTRKEDLSPEAQKLVSYNREEARKLLREAGYAEGKGPLVNMIATTGYGLAGPYPTAIEMMGKMFEEAGFRVKIDWQEHARWQASGVAGSWGEGNARAHPWNAQNSGSLGRFYCGQAVTVNRGNVCDPEYAPLMEKWLATTDPQQSWELAKAVQSRMIEQVYGIPGVVGFDFVLWQPWVKNFTYVDNRFPRPIAYLWLDK